MEGSNSLVTIVMLLLVVVFFYFFLIRPQKKQEKQQAEMRNSLEIGDEVITIGGIIGQVVKIKGETVTIATGKDRTTIRFLRNAIREVTVKIDRDEVDLSLSRVTSRKLAERLAGCERAVVFAATVGLEIDRLIAKHSRRSPAHALCLQAIGTERTEALCDLLCEGLEEQFCAEGKRTRMRFSPGYGDLPLAMQRDIFRLLDCPRRIGLTLADSLLMTPTKSVTAVIGLGASARTCGNKCMFCTKENCIYREVIV